MNIEEQPENQLRALQQGWRRMIYETEFTHFVTFNFNPCGEMSLKYAEDKLFLFANKINRELHGRNFNKKYRHERTTFTVAPEHLNSNLHYHGGLWTPDKAAFNEIADDVWQSIVPAGDLFFRKKTYDDADRWTIAGYVTKCIVKYKTDEHIVVYSAPQQP